MAITFWSFFTATQVRPFWVGPLTLSFVYDLVFIAGLYAKATTLENLETSFNFLSDEVVK